MKNFYNCYGYWNRAAGNCLFYSFLRKALAQISDVRSQRDIDFFFNMIEDTELATENVRDTELVPV